MFVSVFANASARGETSNLTCWPPSLPESYIRNALLRPGTSVCTRLPSSPVIALDDSLRSRRASRKLPVSVQGGLTAAELPAALMEAPPHRTTALPASSYIAAAAAAASCLASQPLRLAARRLPPQHYKALGGRHECAFEEMTETKIRLAMPLKRVFVVKMRVTAGRRGAPKPFDKQPKVQSANGRGGEKPAANFQAAYR